MNIIHITNNGQEIEATNYWDTPQGRLFHAVSVNAGCLRLLVPEKFEGKIPDMLEGCDYAIVSTVPNPGLMEFSLEILFEDHTQSPYSLQMSAGSVIGFFPKADPTPVERSLSIWIKGEAGPLKVGTLKAFTRTVRSVPWLKPL